MLYIVTIIDVQTSTAQISNYFCNELQASYHLNNTAHLISQKVSLENPSYKVTPIQVSPNRFDIRVLAPGWVYSTKSLDKVVQLIEVEEIIEPVNNCDEN